MSARSCSLACRLFFECDPLMSEEPPHRAVARRRAAPRQLRHHRSQRQVRLLGGPRPHTPPLSLFSSSCRQPPILYAAALPVARKRCDHFTTLATLTPNSAAVARHERPATTEPTTRSRRSCE